MNPEDRIKLFGMSHQLVERELDQIEHGLGLELGREDESAEDVDDIFYPQFDEVIRHEASSMAIHYELFYCLEKSIRSIISDVLQDKHGLHWWDTHVPEPVKKEVTQNMQREIDQAVAARSASEIDYTTFGQLGEIVRGNWSDFGDIFNSKKAFNKVMTSLNLLRGPIAHCSPLPASEVVRLRTTVEDWFRLMA
ncbi:MAG: Swt1 family HEPN domain-containing protein [Acidobacteriota bacterium]